MGRPYFLNGETMAAIAIKVKKDNYKGAVAVTPNDSADLADPVSALHISVAGTLKVTTIGGDIVSFPVVPVGTLELAVVKVFATGTAATGIVGLK